MDTETKNGDVTGRNARKRQFDGTCGSKRINGRIAKVQTPERAVWTHSRAYAQRDA